MQEKQRIMSYNTCISKTIAQHKQCASDIKCMWKDLMNITLANTVTYVVSLNVALLLGKRII